MMKIGKTVGVALLVGILASGLSGCEKQGPMERTGKEMDKAAEKTGQQLDKALKKPVTSLKRPGRKLKKSVK